MSCQTFVTLSEKVTLKPQLQFNHCLTNLAANIVQWGDSLLWGDDIQSKKGHRLRKAKSCLFSVHTAELGQKLSFFSDLMARFNRQYLSLLLISAGAKVDFRDKQSNCFVFQRTCV